MNLALVLLAAALSLGPGPAGATEPPGGGEGLSALVEPARAGLHRLLDATADTGAHEPLRGCALIGREAADAAFAAGGVDAPLAAWLQRVGPWPGGADVRAVTCAGSYVGAEDDPSFPELTAALLVADFGDAAAFARAVPEADGPPRPAPGLGGSTVGRCAEVDLTHQCQEYWASGGLVVGLWVADRVFVDRPTMSAVLAGLVPTVLATLAGRATDVADPLAGITTAVVEAAAAGLAGATTRGPCPLVDEAEVAAALAGAGSDLPTDGWAAAPLPRSLEGAVVAVQCTGGLPDATVAVTAADFGDAGAADDFVASVGLADGGSAADLEPGDLTVGTCTAVGRSRYCVEWWRQGGLAVGVALFGGSAVTQDAAADVLVALVPAVLAHLAA